MCRLCSELVRLFVPAIMFAQARRHQLTTNNEFVQAPGPKFSTQVVAACVPRACASVKHNCHMSSLKLKTWSKQLLEYLPLSTYTVVQYF